jgi:hypothetical protein
MRDRPVQTGDYDMVTTNHIPPCGYRPRDFRPRRDTSTSVTPAIREILGFIRVTEWGRGANVEHRSRSPSAVNYLAELNSIFPYESTRQNQLIPCFIASSAAHP